MTRVRRALPALGFVVLALALTWPLPLHLSTHLTGSPSGDTGVYVWNLWIFHHELVDLGQWPFTTNLIFSSGRSAELSTHNYTVLPDLLALPLLRTLGVVRTFNLIYLLLIASSGYAVFLLARHLIRRQPEAWIAGAVFAASPFLTARGTGHFSLVAAAPLAIFVLYVLKALERGRRPDAALAGIAIGWAGYCDPYYAIYCGLMGAVLVAHHVWQPESRTGDATRGPALRVVNVLLVGGGAVLGWRLWHGEFSTVVFGRELSFRSFYTPMFVLTVLMVIRTQLVWRFRWHRRRSARSPAQLIRLGLTTIAATAAMLSPLMVGLASRLSSGNFPSPSIGWRSSPPGLDLVDLFVPNPNHPWFGEPGMRWIVSRGPIAYPEFAASLPLVALAVIAWAVWRVRGAVPRFWVGFTALFATIALGPFIQVGGVNTAIPGPWWVLRYVPIVGLARSPARAAVVATLGFCILLGFALAALRRTRPTQARATLTVVCALLAFELAPVPRALFDARIPSVYEVVRADANARGAVLDLPGGVRDGTSSIGDYNPASQFFQTFHGKPLIGGYQSRISDERRRVTLEDPVLTPLYRLSEGQPITPEMAARAMNGRDTFFAQSCLAYVVFDRPRVSPQLRQLAVTVFDLVPVAEGHDRELLRPARALADSCR